MSALHRREGLRQDLLALLATLDRPVLDDLNGALPLDERTGLGTESPEAPPLFVVEFDEETPEPLGETMDDGGSPSLENRVLEASVWSIAFDRSEAMAESLRAEAAIYASAIGAKRRVTRATFPRHSGGGRVVYAVRLRFAFEYRVNPRQPDVAR